MNKLLTDKAKARLRAIPLLVCSVACVACSIPIALHTSKAQVYEEYPMGSSSRLTMSHLGTYEVYGYFDNPGGNYRFTYNVPRYGENPTFPSYSNTDYTGTADVNPAINWELVADSSEQIVWFHSGEDYIPAIAEEVVSLKFSTTTPFNMTQAMFLDLLHETQIFMPTGIDYNFKCKIEYRNGGHTETINFSVNNLSYYVSSGAPSYRNLRDLIEVQILQGDVGYHYNGVEYVYISSLQYEFVPARQSTAQGAVYGTNDVMIASPVNRYTFYDLEVVRYVYIDYLGISTAPPPTVGDTLLSPLTAFFSTELFEGFSMGSLLLIALGCLLFGLFLKIFVGG